MEELRELRELKEKYNDALKIIDDLESKLRESGWLYTLDRDHYDKKKIDNLMSDLRENRYTVQIYNLPKFAYPVSIEFLNFNTERGNFITSADCIVKYDIVINE